MAKKKHTPAAPEAPAIASPSPEASPGGAASARAPVAAVAAVAVDANDTRPLWQRVLVVALPAAAGVPLLFASRYIWQIVGTGLSLISLYGLLPQLVRGIGSLDEPWLLRGREVRWLPRALPAFALVLVAAVLLWPTFLGQMVQSQDHTIHLSRVWLFINKMLGHGQLSGWSDWWFAGYPAGEDYPPGGDYWIASVYLGTLGLLGWEASYALAFLAMYAVAALGVYAFGRVYFGRLAGFLGALFFLLDRGQYREGGWNYTVWWGVWPQVLSTGFTFLSFALLERVLLRGRPRDYALVALASGFAFLAHPVAVMYFGLGLPIFLVARALSADELPVGRVVARSLAAVGLGGALAAFWVLPFVAKGAWMAKYGELWKSLPSMGSGLWQGTLFDNAMPPVIILGVLGGAVALWQRRFGGIFLTAYVAATLFIASSTAFQRLDLLTLSPSFGQIQFQRLSILAKPCVWLLAGYALAVLFTRVVGQLPTFRWRRYALNALILLAVAPFLRPAAEHYGQTYGRELARPLTRKQVAHRRDYQAFLRWSKDIREAELKAGFYRISYVRSYNDHYFGAATVYNHTPMYKVGYTPAINFKFKPDTADPRLYKLLNVKYVVAIGGQGGPLVLHKSFGAINVYRYKDYTTQRHTLRGPGQVEVLRFDPAGAGMRFKISGATPASKLVVHVANYPNWRARANGEALPIATGSLEGHEIFIEVPAKNGIVELYYGWPAINIFGSLLSWLAVAVLLSFVIARYRPAWVARPRAWLLPWALRAERWGLVLGVAVLLVLGAGLALKGKKRETPVPGVSLIDRIDDAEVELVRSGVAGRCPKQGRRHQCTAASWNYVGPSSQRVGDALRRCIWAHPVANGTLRATFRQQTLGRAIVGHHGLTDSAVQSFSGGAAVTLKLLLDGKPVLTSVRSNTKAWAEFRQDTVARAGQKADVTFEITTRRAGGRHYCFEAVLAR